ncbi:ADP-ribosylglycohydrolase family protein [Chitinimonas prasina]|nr:ADP-ribosylglycohydrolase family protein [Chitinimonas prasina]
MKHTRSERIQGALWGLLVGDALGVPYEFNAPDLIPVSEAIEFDPPADFRRSHSAVPSGTWSDDGAHALCLLASLLQCGRLDPADLMRRLHDWYESGYMAVDQRVFDVGVQTSRALAAFRAGVPALDAGPAGARDNGNGSLMRVLPLALWHKGSDAELVADARLQSRVTHGHARAQLCCALYCLWARAILNEVDEPWTYAVAVLRTMCGDGSEEQAELEFYIRPDDEMDGRGSSYVVDSLRSARTALAADGYEAVVRAAIRLGNDTDTTACLAGGLAGLRGGLDDIPLRWREKLRGRALFLPLLEQLLQRG